MVGETTARSVNSPTVEPTGLCSPQPGRPAGRDLMAPLTVALALACRVPWERPLPHQAARATVGAAGAGRDTPALKEWQRVCALRLIAQHRARGSSLRSFDGQGVSGMGALRIAVPGPVRPLVPVTGRFLIPFGFCMADPVRAAESFTRLPPSPAPRHVSASHPLLFFFLPLVRRDAARPNAYRELCTSNASFYLTFKICL